jgi:hypothetical protein
MYIEGDVPYVGTNNNSNNGWNDWSWIIGLALVGGLFGNGGFGFGGGNRGGYGYCGCGSPATVQDVASGFSTSEIMSDLNDIILGQAQGFAGVQQTLCQGFSGVNSTVTNGFANLNTNLASFAYNTQNGFNSVSREIADCCCTTQRAIDSVKYENAKNTCDIIRAGQDNTRAILDYLTGEKISALQAENSGLKAQISNDRQTRTIIDEIKPCPIPAYITCNPYQSAYGFGFNGSNCGCGCN